MEQDKITGVYIAVSSDPVLIHRVINVSRGMVHTLTNKMLNLLRKTWKGRLEGMIMSCFELEVFDCIRNPEVEALFTHFYK